MPSRLRQGARKVGPRGLAHTSSKASDPAVRSNAILKRTRNAMGLQPDITTRPGTHGRPEQNCDYQKGNWLTICFGWSAAMMFGIYVAGDSGAYLNPAITLTNCFFRGLPLRRWPSYAISQLLGAFCGHGLVYANYISAIDQYEGHDIRSIPPSSTSTASFFCTFPESFVPIGSRFFSEFIANFFITFLIMAVRDENGADLKGGGFFVLAFFWMNFVMIASFGWETGSPTNPARDLTGRIWLSILGYKNAWSAYDYYFWIPLFAPFIGCFCGAFVYDFFIYTGDSPLHNGAWNPKRLWKKLGKKDKRPQSDEEKLDGRGGDEDSGSTCERVRGDAGSQRTVSEIAMQLDGTLGVQQKDWFRHTDSGYNEPQEEEEPPAKSRFHKGGWEAAEKQERRRKDPPFEGTDAQKAAFENIKRQEERDGLNHPEQRPSEELDEHGNEV
ncbi:hypothetical protein VPNG_06777 [Cytospora leucostoma]|uniref:Aquaporin n=1 Tax=Cytospora leucostoma TaxID=1230097 RepID=A0A423WSX7_9PEZI|nr:hypothetical protein VPNG_06777 [Cytospora leucostoma]